MKNKPCSLFDMENDQKLQKQIVLILFTFNVYKFFPFDLYKFFFVGFNNNTCKYTLHKI